MNAADGRGHRDENWSSWGSALRLLLRGRTARIAVPVAAVVGTVLSSVNQAANIASGHTGAGTWIRVAVNYLVPFLVSSYGYLTARRVRRPAVSGAAG
ncbi:nitrate/nitrite transporter NrtS [Actinacidiphila alni]|uniref:nitrate/nitrite transporter NrtS n=1 Tax=Actinacidiphila alni TaxID=380248 RepID=UPI00345623CE